MCKTNFRGANFVIFFEMRKQGDDIWHIFSYSALDNLYLCGFYSLFEKKTMKRIKNVMER